jgi:hypothetical protein
VSEIKTEETPVESNLDSTNRDLQKEILNLKNEIEKLTKSNQVQLKVNESLDSGKSEFKSLEDIEKEKIDASNLIKLQAKNEILVDELYEKFDDKFKHFLTEEDKTKIKLVDNAPEATPDYKRNLRLRALFENKDNLVGINDRQILSEINNFLKREKSEDHNFKIENEFLLNATKLIFDVRQQQEEQGLRGGVEQKLVGKLYEGQTDAEYLALKSDPVYKKYYENENQF